VSHHDRIGPIALVGLLLGVGLLGGARGRLLLKRLRRASGWAVLLLTAIGVTSCALTDAKGPDFSLSYFLLAILAALFWCYVALALWLTSEEAHRRRD
jgi:hypothetical protein